MKTKYMVLVGFLLVLGVGLLLFPSVLNTAAEMSGKPLMALDTAKYVRTTGLLVVLGTLVGFSFLIKRR